MAYSSQRERVKEIIEKELIPSLEKKPTEVLSYDQIVLEIQTKVGASQEVVEEIINSFIKLKRLGTERTIFLLEERVVQLLNEQRKEIEKELKKAGVSTEKLDEH